MNIKLNFKIPPALEKAAGRVDDQEPRKRIMMLLIAILGMAMVWQNFILLPFENKAQMLLKVREELHKSLPELQKKLAESATEEKKIDPGILRRQRIQELEAERQTLTDRLGKETDALIQPTEMLAALKRLLAERPEVKLIRLEASRIMPIQLGSAATSGLVADKTGKKDDKEAATPQADNKPGNEAVIFRHDIELEVEASYLNTLALFEEIKRYPWVFYWDEARYEAMNYPKTRTMIRLFTLSMGQGLIGG